MRGRFRIGRTTHFVRSYRKLEKFIQEDFDQKISWFIKNPFDPRLKTHFLKGRHKDKLAFNLVKGYRVLFKYVKKNEVLLVEIGLHQIYYER